MNDIVSVNNTDDDIEEENMERQRKNHSFEKLLRENPPPVDKPPIVQLDAVRPKRQKHAKRGVYHDIVPLQSLEHEMKIKEKMEKGEYIDEDLPCDTLDDEATEILDNPRKQNPKNDKIKLIIISIVIAILLIYFFRNTIKKFFGYVQGTFSTHHYQPNDFENYGQEGGYLDYNPPPPIPPQRHTFEQSMKEDVNKENIEEMNKNKFHGRFNNKFHNKYSKFKSSKQRSTKPSRGYFKSKK
jgi:hypothetical protein